MKATCIPASNSFDVATGCDYCGKPITTSGPSGMTCKDRCTDKWVRWDRLGRPSFQKHLERLGKLEEALAERELLAQQLFKPDGTPKAL
jgi:hypothetical protein